MGRFPKRKGFNGMASRSWAEASTAWDGFIPPEQLPRLYDPPEGFIVTANNRTLGRDYPYVIAHNWELGYRAHRITELLQGSNGITEQATLAMQLDTRSEFYEFYRQLALQELKAIKRNEGKVNQSEQTLLAWDGFMHADSKGAALLMAFRTKLAEALFAKVVARCKQYDPNFSYAWREMETPLRELLTQRPKGVIPAQYNDDWRVFILETLTSAAKDLQSDYPDIELAQLNWGTVTVRVYLMPTAGRRGETAKYTINFALSVDNQSSKSATPSETGPEKFDAYGEIKCSADKQTLDQWCEFRVLRDLSKHSAEIWITNIAFKDEVHYRVLYFADGKFTTNDKAKLAWQRQDDNWWVSIDGREFYFIPDALIYGG
jgi:hypothetical protein